MSATTVICGWTDLPSGKRQRTRLTIIRVAALVVALDLFPIVAAAQMSYSTYSDAWVSTDISTMYGYGSLEDYGGCSGGGDVYTNVVSPSGRWSGGWGQSAALAVLDEEGWWGTSTDWYINCYCAGAHTMYLNSNKSGILTKRHYQAAYQLANVSEHRWTEVAACPSHKCQFDEYYEYVDQQKYQLSLKEGLPLYLNMPGDLIKFDIPNVGWVEYCRWTYTTQDVGWYYCSAPG